LNVSFEELRTVLPPSDSNASLGKADVINHAVDFIRILQNEKLKMTNIHSKFNCKNCILKILLLHINNIFFFMFFNI
jgi:hypothetical protein